MMYEMCADTFPLGTILRVSLNTDWTRTGNKNTDQDMCLLVEIKHYSLSTQIVET